MFTSDTLPYYLMEQRLVPQDTFVNGEVTITAVRSRNQSFKVIHDRPQGYFVKQALLAAGQIHTLQREAEWYRWIHQEKHKPFTELQPFLPAYYGFDEEQSLLVTALVPDGLTVREVHRLRRHCPPEIGQWLGQALAACHQIRPAMLPPSMSRRFQAHPPWILMVDNEREGMNESQSPAKGEILAIIRQEAALVEALRSLREQWRPTTMTHGDLKWENCLIPFPHPHASLTGLLVVDWETCAIGDPAWDVGSILHSYIAQWVMSMPTAPGRTAADMVARAESPIEQMHPALQRFWQTYHETMTFSEAEKVEWLLRSVRSAGARLLQTAYEQMQRARHISSHSVYLLQLGDNLLNDPHTAAHDLLQLV